MSFDTDSRNDFITLPKASLTSLSLFWWQLCVTETCHCHGRCEISGHKNNTNKNDQSLPGMPNPAWQQTLILILTVFPNNP